MENLFEASSLAALAASSNPERVDVWFLTELLLELIPFDEDLDLEVRRCMIHRMFSSTLFADDDDDDEDDDDAASSDAGDDDDGILPTPTSKKAKRQYMPRTYYPRKTIEECNWYQKFLSHAIQEIVQDPESRDGKTFRTLFRVPWKVFCDLVDETVSRGWYDPDRCDALGRRCGDIRILIMGALYVLGQGVTQKVVESNSYLSENTHRVFFISWCQQMHSAKLEFISFPESLQDIARVLAGYARFGHPGAIGSMDGVHLAWNACPSDLTALCTGVHGYPSLLFQVVCDSQKYIQFVGGADYGSWNDKTAVKYSACLKRLQTGLLLTYKWYTMLPDGSVKEFMGVYFVVDGGYLQLPLLICAHPNPRSRDEKAMASKHGATRKDIEDVFGILKKRFRFVKNPCDLPSLEQVECAFVTCCILHNILLEHDGYRDADYLEAPGGVMAEIASAGREGSWLQSAVENAHEFDSVVAAQTDVQDRDQWMERIDSLVVHQRVFFRRSNTA